MKSKYAKKIILLLIISTFAFGINKHEVKAATATINEVGSKYYFYSKSSNSKYGEYYGASYKSGIAEKYTRYKELLIGGTTKAIAYCVQSTDKSPKASSNYTEITWGSSYGGKVWNEKQALLAGRVIEKIRADKSDSTEEYVYTFSALNSLLRLDGSLNFAGYNSKIQSYLTEANEYYSSTISPTTTLPAFKITANNSGMMDSHVPSTASGTTYYTGSISINNLLQTYGGDSVTYTVSISSTNGTVGICTTSSCAGTSGTTQTITGVTEKTLYLKATNITQNDKITVKVTGSNSSTYRIARLWKHSTAPNTYQALATYSSKSYKRTRNAETTLYIPDPTTKTFAVEKIDNNDGKSIEGSDLTMTIYTDSNKTNQLASCSITSGKTTCSNKVDNNIASNLYYSITETKAPSGYILGTEITGTWNLESNNETCKKSKIGEENWETASITDCNTNYIKGNICLDKENNTYTEGECEIEIPDTGTEEGTGTITPAGETETDSSQEGNENGGNTGAGEEEGNDPGTTPPEENQFETQEKCYIINNGGVIPIEDQTKCDYDYLKVTVNKGNLRIQFPNTKNTVKISKQSITGAEEISGAELKICSDKPDEKGNCTIVRNTLSGICKADTTDTENGGAKLTNEFNCEYDEKTNQKTIDMHWFSGDAPKIWHGLSKGTYYLIETLAPRGYIISTTITEFTIDDTGKITSKTYDEENNQIVLKNELTQITVSKTDAATSKELPGATISICNAYKDENGKWAKFVNDEGYCSPVILADGTPATWESTDKPHIIEGLGVGAYYLVETIAPKGYSTAESILFIMNKDGKLTDKDGKSLKDNKLEMKDKLLEDKKTGDLPILIIVLIAVGTISIASYYYINNNAEKTNNLKDIKEEETINKKRKRKIHK